MVRIKASKCDNYAFIKEQLSILNEKGYLSNYQTNLISVVIRSNQIYIYPS